MASIFDFQTADTIATGLQGCNVCDEALQMARKIAAERGATVVLEDDDGNWAISQNGEREKLAADWAS